MIYDGENISLLDFGLARFADRRNIRFSLDYARAADVLLYSSIQGIQAMGKSHGMRNSRLRMLASGDFRHSESDKKRQSQSI